MKIELLDATPNPVDLISQAAGTCYGKNDSSTKRVKRAYDAGHLSVFEHVKVTVRVEGISRACANQLVRHRMASFCQESMRYVKIDTSNDDWYIPCPASYDDKRYIGVVGYRFPCKKLYDEAMKELTRYYNLLLDCGVPAEDARLILPLATKTNIVMSMNLRELYHFLELREDSHAQWEIQELAKGIRNVIETDSSQWEWLMSLDKKD